MTFLNDVSNSVNRPSPLPQFDDLTLNIPSTYVYLKVSAHAFGISFTSSISVRIIDVTLAEVEDLSVEFGTSLQEAGSTSSYNKEINRYTADATPSTAADEDGRVSNPDDDHTSFDGTFIVQDYYEDSTCSSNLLWYEYVKKDVCIASSTGNSSEILESYTSVQVTSDQYEGTTICQEKGISNSSSVGHNIGETQLRAQQRAGNVTIAVEIRL